MSYTQRLLIKELLKQGYTIKQALRALDIQATHDNLSIVKNIKKGLEQ